MNAQPEQQPEDDFLRRAVRTLDRVRDFLDIDVPEKHLSRPGRIIYRELTEVIEGLLKESKKAGL